MKEMPSGSWSAITALVRVTLELFDALTFATNGVPTVTPLGGAMVSEVTGFEGARKRITAAIAPAKTTKRLMENMINPWRAKKERCRGAGCCGNDASGESATGEDDAAPNDDVSMEVGVEDFTAERAERGRFGLSLLVQIEFGLYSGM